MTLKIKSQGALDNKEMLPPGAQWICLVGLPCLGPSFHLMSYCQLTKGCRGCRGGSSARATLWTDSDWHSALALVLSAVTQAGMRGVLWGERGCTVLCPSHQWIRSWLWFLAGPSYKGHSSSFQGLLSQRQRAADPQNGNQRGPENCPPEEALQNLLEATMTQSQWAQAMWRR